MHAVVLHEFGPATNLRYEQVEDPKPGPGQLRIAVRAAGVHFLDTMIRRGVPGPFPPPALPMISGREVAGVIDALGPDVDPAWLGRRAVGHLGLLGAGYAELAVAAATGVHALDDAVDDAEAVAMIGTGRTAVAVLETGVGGVRGRGALELLPPGGRILFYGWSSGEPTPLSVADLVGRGISAASAVGVRLTDRPGGLREIEEQALARLVAGRWTPLLTRFPLARAAAAHTALETRQTVGKVVLIP